MVVAFELEGCPFLALNGGPDHFNFDESISFSIDCATQDEVDHYWDSLSEGGAESPSLKEALDRLADMAPHVDEWWTDIAPWPRARADG